jgi:vacuolar-type H+-ATPase subunit C/Vma6
MTLDPEPGSAEHFQRRLVQDLIQELAGFRRHVDEAGQQFVNWLLARFQLENMKVLLRGLVNQTPMETLQPHLAVLPGDQALNAKALLAAGSVEIFADRLPAGRPRDRLGEILIRLPEAPRPFLLEAALDCGYYQELLARTAELHFEEREIISSLVYQESNFFQLMLVVRGKFKHELPAKMLLPLRVAASGVAADWFQLLLAAPDMPALAQYSLGSVVDEWPVSRGPGDSKATLDPAMLEALAWNRLFRLANAAFRRSHMGLGAVAGYVVLRRMEIANLITVSEGIRLGLDAGILRSRLVPRTDLEVAHV